MRLGTLAGLERIEIENEKADLLKTLEYLNTVLQDLVSELRKRLQNIVNKYGDDRKTELAQIEEPKTKEEKEIINVPPEKCVVVITKSGNLKRIPATSFRTQRRGGKGIKTQDDITECIIRTNTIDNLMLFTNKGQMYRVLVNNIPEGTNTTKGTPVRALVEMEPTENVQTIYSIYRETDAKFVLFVTKNGIVKKTGLDEYINTKKAKGIAAIKLKENDALASVCLIKDEPIILITKKGRAIKFNANEIAPSSRVAIGVKSIDMDKDDEVIIGLPVRQSEDNLAVFTDKGYGKRLDMSELPLQKRAGRGIVIYKESTGSGFVTAAQLVNDEDTILIVGNNNSICISASEITTQSRSSSGVLVLKNDKVISVSKV